MCQIRPLLWDSVAEWGLPAHIADSAGTKGCGSTDELAYELLLGRPCHVVPQQQATSSWQEATMPVIQALTSMCGNNSNTMTACQAPPCPLLPLPSPHLGLAQSMALISSSATTTSSNRGRAASSSAQQACMRATYLHTHATPAHTSQWCRQVWVCMHAPQDVQRGV